MFRWLFGKAHPPELYVVDVENKSAEAREATVTFCMQAQIDKGKTLGFRMSSMLCNHGTKEHRNPLYVLRDSLKVEQDERIIIHEMERLHYHNELGGDLVFALEHWYDIDQATQAIREKRDAALSATNKTVNVSRPKSIVNDNNTNGRVKLDAATDTEGDFTRLMLTDDESTGSSSSAKGGLRRPAGKMTPQQVLDELDETAAYGSAPHANKAERDNVISLGLLKANTSHYEKEQVYRASLSDMSIRWFAGQDHVVADPQVNWVSSKPVTNSADAAYRNANTATHETTLLDADHALVTYINHCRADLTDVDQGMRPLQSDRADDRIKYFSVDRRLLDEARRSILFKVYAQMYYTQLRDCYVVRRCESEQGEIALALRVAEQWGLAVHPETKLISDWGPHAYRPVVMMTLRIRYTVASGVSSSAASLHKTRTRLVPVK
jgi:hypothetical protein